MLLFFLSLFVIVYTTTHNKNSPSNNTTLRFFTFFIISLSPPTYQNHPSPTNGVDYRIYKRSPNGYTMESYFLLFSLSLFLSRRWHRNIGGRKNQKIEKRENEKKMEEIVRERERKSWLSLHGQLETQRRRKRNRDETELEKKNMYTSSLSLSLSLFLSILFSLPPPIRYSWQNDKFIPISFFFPYPSILLCQRHRIWTTFFSVSSCFQTFFL